MYEKGTFDALERDFYVKLVCDQLEIMPKDVVIERVTGDGIKEALISPMWSTKKTIVTNEIDKEFAKRNTYQGFLC